MCAKYKHKVKAYISFLKHEKKTIINTKTFHLMSKYNKFPETVSVISNDPFCKDGNSQRYP